MKKKRGITIIEMMVAVVIASLAMLAVSFIFIGAYRDIGESKRMKSLQEDVDIASYTIKSIIEEASSFEIESEEHIIVRYEEDWEKAFTLDGNKLMLDDKVVIETLKIIKFEEDGDDAVIITIEVEEYPHPRSLQNSFRVWLRNQ